MKIIHNAPEVARGLDLYQKRTFMSIQKAVAISMAHVVRAAVKYIRTRDIIAEGSLLSSITSVVRRETERIIGEAGTNMQHAVFVHQGTRPHWPPPGPIQKWVALKMRRGMLETDDIRSTAFLVSRAISRRGTRARPFLAVSLRSQQSRMVREVVKAIQGSNPSMA